jgi:hypothetical protein
MHSGVVEPIMGQILAGCFNNQARITCQGAQAYFSLWLFSSLSILCSSSTENVFPQAE